jgi:hypothetical protein
MISSVFSFPSPLSEATPLLPLEPKATPLSSPKPKAPPFPPYANAGITCVPSSSTVSSSPPRGLVMKY